MRPDRSHLAVRIVRLATATFVLELAQVGAVLAASPTPGSGGDPRSSGQGPGLVGDPAFAILAVLAIGLVTLAVTLAYVRVTGGRRTD